MDLYQTLGINYDASNDEVKHAYRLMCKKYNPKNKMNDEDRVIAEKHLHEVQRAYAILMKNRFRTRNNYSRNSGKSIKAKPIVKDKGACGPVKWCVDMFLLNLFCNYCFCI
jgi:DnaJ-class molecular chaperone